MAATEQVNVRVPSATRGLILHLAARLRDDQSFAGRLKRWLAEQADPSIGPLLSDRVEHLERHVKALLAARDAAGVPGSTPAAVDSPSNIIPPTVPGWTTGTGRGRRLTSAGKAEIERRIQAGEPDAEIARSMGVQPYTVANHRKKLGEQPG
ncbi:MAG TPA: helix-turn-helix domain-containing protein [Geminicoccus sp.]|uniref:helix-turn-helix domain-containing protein n=1 Tax=Geminicoccus sp. TaxID=2024832 RepID=UPI002BAF01A4|nr:helix-turn-helix domain-containing protein [Geminicoccus sp.]HWL69670.1 helix-turn-helix domain-containing protein [Geminicoccus sp.]